MAIEDDMQRKSIQLVQQIKEAEQQNKPIDSLVKQHINLLEEFHDVFIKRAEERNFNTLDKISGELNILTNIRSWTKKIGLPVEEYDKKIYELRCKIFGSDCIC